MPHCWIRIALGHIDELRNGVFLNGSEVVRRWIPTQTLDFGSYPFSSQDLPGVGLCRPAPGPVGVPSLVGSRQGGTPAEPNPQFPFLPPQFSLPLPRHLPLLAPP